MVTNTMYWWFGSVFTPEICQKIISLGESKITEAKKFVKEQEKIHKETVKKIQALGKIKSFKPMANLFDTNQIEGIEVYQIPDEEDTEISDENLEETEI